MVIFLIVVVGLILGSFLNALIWRLKVKESVLRGRSYCPHCKHPLGILDLIPFFSFVFQKGRCRYCGQRISWMYPLVELAVVFSFLVIYFYFALSLEFFVYSIYSLFLIVIFTYDWRWQTIPDQVTILGMVVAFGLHFVLPLKFTEIVLGAIIGGGFFFLQYFISRGRWIGGGDIRLGLLMGLMLGWQRLLIALFLAYFFGALVGIFLILSKKKKFKSYLSFGPFLSFFTYLAIIFGDNIISWYFNYLIKF